MSKSIIEPCFDVIILETLLSIYKKSYAPTYEIKKWRTKKKLKSHEVQQYL